MRTTVELSDLHRQVLSQLSHVRGYRGYSRIIEEAIDFFVERNPFNKNERLRLLKLKGSWSDTEAGEVRSTLSEVRKNWTRSY